MRFEALRGGSKPYPATHKSARMMRWTPAFGGMVQMTVIAMLVLGGAGEAYAKEDKLNQLLSPQIDKGGAPNLPLLLQADELAYDNKNSRVVAKGNVEVYYKNYVLTCDQLIYEQKTNTLNAVGNVRIKEPDGAVVTAERITL